MVARGKIETKQAIINPFAHGKVSVNPMEVQKLTDGKFTVFPWGKRNTFFNVTETKTCVLFLALAFPDEHVTFKELFLRISVNSIETC